MTAVVVVATALFLAAFTGALVAYVADRVLDRLLGGSQ